MYRVLPSYWTFIKAKNHISFSSSFRKKRESLVVVNDDVDGTHVAVV